MSEQPSSTAVWSSAGPESPPEPAELRRALTQDGYVHLRGWLEPALAARVRDDVTDTLDRIGWAPGAASSTSVVSKIGRQEGSEGWWAGYREIQALERFHRLAFVPPLERLYRAFFPTWIVHPRKWANLIYPDFAVPAHQDYPAVQGPVDTLTVWVPLTDADPDRGRLRVVPGSHRGGVAPMVQLPQAGVSLADPPAGPSWLELDTRLGDVVVLHSLSVHEVSPNRSADIDLSAEYRVQDARDPLTPASLIPHHWPRIPSARVLSRGWQSRRWIRRPWLVRTERFRMPPTVESWHTVLDPGPSRWPESEARTRP